MALTRQQLEQQLVAAHRSGNVQAAQQAAYAIRAYDQAPLSAQVPSVNAPPPIERVPKPTFGSWLGNVGIGYGEELGRQVRDIGGMVERGVSAFTQDPLKASAAAVMSVLEPWRQGLTQPAQAAKDVGTGIVETGKQMYQQATSGPIGLGQTIGQMIDLPGPSLPGNKRRPTMAELDVYHGTPHTFEPEEGAPLGRFRSEKIGTGEGAQAYGYGLYFSEAPSVAKTYQGSVSAIHKSGVPTIEGKPINWDDPRETAAFELSRHNGDRAAAADFHARMFLGGEDNPAVKLLRSNEPLPTVDMPGRLYQVDLPDAKIEQMLDWDKPLKEQPKEVRQALTRLAQNAAQSDEQLMKDFQKLGPSAPANQLYAALVQRAVRLKKYEGMRAGIPEDKAMPSLTYGQQIASEQLRQAGIPGIKYLDAGSRASEKGTRNFVVFPGEEQSLTILERDGVKAEVPKAAAPKFDVSADSTNKIRDAKVGNTQISYQYDGNIASIASVRTPSGKRNQGSARAAMEQFLAETDALGIPVKLESSPLDKRTTDARLFNFYKSLGFEPTGRKINAAGDPEMIRQPNAAIQQQSQSTTKPRVATWFSGGGTVESALPNHERVMAAEYNPQINEQANKTFGTSFPARDVNKIDPQELKAAKPDLFHASPVCKNFSAAKTMRGATELDRESAQSVANAIRVATPPVVTIENVPQYADTALFKHITDALDDKGYKWDVVIHDAADYGAPQSRKRMLLRAVREGELPPLPPKTGGKDWYAAVSDLLPDAPDAVIPPVERRRLDDMIAAGKLDPSKPIITMGGSGFKGTWAAANAGGVAPTLKAANEKPRVIMPDGTVKTVTGRMMARLMGLGDDVPVPDNQTLAKTVLGNGVSGDVTKALIAPLLNRSK